MAVACAAALDAAIARRSVIGDNDGDDEAVAGDDNEQKMTEAQAAVVKRACRRSSQRRGPDGEGPDKRCQVDECARGDHRGRRRASPR